MEDIKVGDIVRVFWTVHNFYYFAIIHKIRKNDMVAYLGNRTIISQKSDPCNIYITYTFGAVTPHEVYLTKNNTMRLPKKTKDNLIKELSRVYVRDVIDDGGNTKWGRPKWSQWDGQPIEYHSYCD